MEHMSAPTPNRKTSDVEGMKEAGRAEIAQAMQKVVLNIQSQRQLTREEAIELVADILGEADRDDMFELLRLPGGIGTKDD